MTTSAQLEQIFGVPFEEQPDLKSLRQFHAGNAFCCNEEGAVIGLCACENEWPGLSIPVEGFQQLQYLNLSDNKSLKELGFEGVLPQLRHLDVSDSGLVELKLHDGFKQLEWLDLSRNKLSRFVPDGKYPNLKYLDLSNNELGRFPANLLLKFPALEGLYLKENPLPDAKKTAVDKQGNCLEFMERFHRALQKGATQNREYKVLLVGNGGVGKTCLVERLIYDTFEKQWISTEGIALEQYSREEFPYILNLWDFGGQDIYHATHRLFMQSNALYLSLWDEETNPQLNPTVTVIEADREREYENFPLSYWLYYIEQQGKHSPVIAVKTKAEADNREHPRKKELLSQYSDSFSSLDFHQIDSKLDDWTDNGFNHLLFLIRQAIKKLNRDEELPESWANLRQHLRKLYREGEQTLSTEDYLDYASDYEIEAPMEVLTDWLVASGVVFYREGYFDDAIILDQAWAIEAIYTLFNRKEGHYHRISDRQKGKFTGKDLAAVWGPKKYSQAEQELFVNFMLGCELCFEIKEKKEREKYAYVPFEERQFIAPQMLPKDQPGSVEVFKDAFKEKGLLHIKYSHAFLHPGIIQRFIVRTQSLADVKDIWRYGILLKEEGSYVLVRAERGEIQVEDNDDVRILKRNEILVTVPESGLTLLEKTRNLLEELQGSTPEVYVSSDGINYVDLEKLQNNKQALIEAENGNMVSAEALSVFLERQPQQKFDLPDPEHQSKAILKKLEKERLIEEHKLNQAIPSQLEFDSSPVTILFLASNPPDTQPIKCEGEYKAILKKLDLPIKNDQYKLFSIKETVSLEDIIDAIEDYEPHILHFCTHGMEEEIDRDGRVSSEGGIVVFSEDKQSGEILDAELLDRQFEVIKEGYPQLKIVFFNACHGSKQAGAISKHGIYAIGTTEEILDEGARLFAAGFYRSLARENDLLLAIGGGIRRAIKKEADIKKLIECYYGGQRLYPNT